MMPDITFNSVRIMFGELAAFPRVKSSLMAQFSQTAPGNMQQNKIALFDKEHSGIVLTGKAGCC